MVIPGRRQYPGSDELLNGFEADAGFAGCAEGICEGAIGDGAAVGALGAFAAGGGNIGGLARRTVAVGVGVEAFNGGTISGIDEGTASAERLVTDVGAVVSAARALAGAGLAADAGTSLDADRYFTTAKTPMVAPSKAAAITMKIAPLDDFGIDADVTNGADVIPAVGSGVAA
jgi:hypothetical protein